MHRIRTAALGVALLIGVGAQAGAQQGQGQGQARGRAARGERAQGAQAAGGPLLRGIQLTEAQKTQVQVIGVRYREQRQALRPQNGERPDSATRVQRMTQLQQINQRQQAELRAVLTSAQQAQFDRNVAEVRERMSERNAGGARGDRGAARGARGARGTKNPRGASGAGAPRPGARVAQAAFRGIELTDAQKTQLGTLRSRQQDERQALARQIRADGQRADSVERVRARALAQKQRGEVRALLTPAQQQQFDQNVTAMQERERGASGARGARGARGERGARPGRRGAKRDA